MKELLNFNIYTKEVEELELKKHKLLNTINPHSYCLTKSDKEFEDALKGSDILLPDGIGIVWALKFLKNVSAKKIAGYDLFIYIAEKINEEHGSVFFLGSSEETLQKIKERVSEEYPNINSSFYSPPFKSDFSDIESSKMCNEVNLFEPDILFVGMTAPKQEKWVQKYKDELRVKNICCVGAVFDFYAGNIKRSSPFWINLGLEWLPRFLKEPKRLFIRNFVSTPKFILEVIFYKIFGKGFL